MHGDSIDPPDAPTLVEGDATELVSIEDAPLDAEAERYVPIGMLGKGGMGEISLCRDVRIARQVAVKSLRAKLRTNEAAKRRFLREARLQGQLEHPAIVPVHDLGASDDGNLFFTMKRVHGVTLAAALGAIAHGDRTRFSRRRLLTAFSNICLAVDFAHTRGVVHRDLKPANIMLGDFGEVYVLDWGIAKVLSATDTPIFEPIELPDGDTPTRGDVVLGTPRYMAPEQMRGEADARSDVFALGRILHEILICEADDPPELANAVRRATAEMPGDRFASARELHAAVESYLDGDRDLEVRRRLADDHVRRAEQALERARQDPTPEVRSEVARELGRALGMEPGNVAALRALARLLGDVPATLPPAAEALLERQWEERGLRLIRSGIFAMLATLLLIPCFAWLGVRTWTPIAVYIACVLGSTACHYASGNRLVTWWRGVGGVLFFGGTVVLAQSMGLLGLMPMTLVITVLAFRINVVSVWLGLVIVLAGIVALVAPFALDAIGVVQSNYVFHDGAVTIVPRLHELPPLETQLYLIGACAFALVVAGLYGRSYVRELRRAQARVAFHAWQLEQLLPPEPVSRARSRES